MLRHAKAGDGVSASEAALRAWLASLATHPDLGKLGKDWERADVSRDHADLVARLQLGSAAEAAGKIAVVTLAMMPEPMRREVDRQSADGKK